MRTGDGKSTTMRMIAGLDEPVNRLDPEGAPWVRNQLKGLAAELHLSEGTVKVHVGRILAKLGLRLPFSPPFLLPGRRAPLAPFVVIWH